MSFAAQAYVPFIDSNKIWVFTLHERNCAGPNCETDDSWTWYKAYFDGEVTVNDTVYHQWMRFQFHQQKHFWKGNDQPDSLVAFEGDLEPEAWFLIREDTTVQKVFWRTESGDELLYDFGAQVGDSLVDDYLVLDRMDINERKGLRLFQYTPTFLEGNSWTLVEGVGGIGGPFTVAQMQDWIPSGSLLEIAWVETVDSIFYGIKRPIENSNYHRLVEKGKIWQVLSATWNNEYECPDEIEQRENIHYSGDTIINDMLYHKLMSNTYYREWKKIWPNYDEDEDCIGTSYEVSDTTLHLLIREEPENRSVFQYFFGEQLVVSYNADVEGQFWFRCYLSPLNSDTCFTAPARDTTMTADGKSRSFMGDLSPEWSDNVWFLEGIGGRAGIVTGHDYAGGGWSERGELICVTLNGETIFGTCNDWVGVGEIERATEFDVFPNPTTGRLNINSIPLTRVHILDLNGRIVYTPVAYAEIDISILEAGTYIAVLEAESKVIRKLIVKQ